MSYLGDSMPLLDRFGRRLRSLRISVTDRCNLRCQYCMPEPDYVWLPRENLLSFEETGAIVDAFTPLGVDRVRITGGEPLLRRDLPVLIEALAARPSIEDLALTTNGVLLASHASALKTAGLHRITVSLDTLHRERFEALTRMDDLRRVLEGIEAAAAAGFDGLKLDTVVIRDVNDDELVPLLEYARTVDAELRFIEYMDVGGATRWTPSSVVSRREILSRLAAHYGAILPLDEVSSAPADRFVLPDGTTFGIISSTTEPFCASCDRSRLTADGVWLLCLYASTGTDLRRPLRAGATRDELQRLIQAVWSVRADRGAEERLGMDRETTLIPVRSLKKDAHLEMHTRGG
jgi:cyclic pyranopterin phosphate synthase